MRASARQARHLHIGGVVQGVGFRPYVYRLATERRLTGWVLNGEDGVDVHIEGEPGTLDDFVHVLLGSPPPAARIAAFDMEYAAIERHRAFEIRQSSGGRAPTVRVCADLPVCAACLRELFDPSDRRYRYPYINCTDCGPRYSIVRGLPYDRVQTTMRDWPMCDACRAEYENPLDRRFHAQPVACAACGPTYVLETPGGSRRGNEAVECAAQLLRDGGIVAVKGLGGYHLACDARNASAVRALRERKYRKERPFALMVRDAAGAREIVRLDDAALALLQSIARPIVPAPALADLPGVAPENDEFGVMLAYTPVQHLLFAAGAPCVLVMTSANRSSEPIAYRDADARRTLDGIADALLMGERAIARRIDDSVVRAASTGPAVLRHARGYAPQAVATLPAERPIVALGGDLKSAVCVVVRGQAFVSQHIGDLEQFDVFESFTATIDDMSALYELRRGDALVVCDAHPDYRSSAYAARLSDAPRAVQHHRAHVASVLAERGAFDEEILGFAFDGTGYGDDGTIWGGEIFSGALRSGLRRVAHLRAARLPGGDAAAQHPVQAAAGFLCDQAALIEGRNFEAPPFGFPPRFRAARELLEKNVRVFTTTSMGRLFDTVAALLGYTRPITFEGQAAMWLEHLARRSAPVAPYPFPFENEQLDYVPLLECVIEDRIAGRDRCEIARAFHHAVASAIITASAFFQRQRIVVSGGVFQNALLLQELHAMLGDRLWTNRVVPANDGGICLGQAALLCCHPELVEG